jgi:hypothetical protein
VSALRWAGQKGSNGSFWIGPPSELPARAGHDLERSQVDENRTGDRRTAQVIESLVQSMAGAGALLLLGLVVIFGLVAVAVLWNKSAERLDPGLLGAIVGGVILLAGIGLWPVKADVLGCGTVLNQKRFTPSLSEAVEYGPFGPSRMFEADCSGARTGVVIWTVLLAVGAGGIATVTLRDDAKRRESIKAQPGPPSG